MAYSDHSAFHGISTYNDVITTLTHYAVFIDLQ